MSTLDIGVFLVLGLILVCLIIVGVIQLMIVGSVVGAVMMVVIGRKKHKVGLQICGWVLIGIVPTILIFMHLIGIVFSVL